MRVTIEPRQGSAAMIFTKSTRDIGCAPNAARCKAGSQVQTPVGESIRQTGCGTADIGDRHHRRRCGCRLHGSLAGPRRLAVGVVFLVALLARKFWRGARRNLLLVFRGISGSRYMPKVGTREPTLMPTPIAQRCGVPVLYGGRLEMNEFIPRTASLSLDKKT